MSISSSGDTAEDDAAYWLVRLSADDVTPEEQQAFERWHDADVAHAAAYQLMVRGNAVADSLLSDPLLQAMAAEVEQPPVRKSSRVWFRMAAAAAVIATASLVALQVDRLDFQKQSETVAFEETHSLIYETERGERSKVSLPDGTRIALNTASRIRIDYVAEQRQVSVLKGQAYFDVAKDPTRPFTVTASGHRVVALGTAFDVRLDNEAVRVTLVEGRVVVRSRLAAERGDDASVEALGEGVVLAPGQQLFAEGGGRVRVSSVALDEVTSWRDGRLVFRGKPLPSVIDEMNRYSTSTFLLADDPRLEAVTISGVFDIGRTSSFVSALEKVYLLDVVPRGGQVVVSMDDTQRAP